MGIPLRRVCLRYCYMKALWTVLGDRDLGLPKGNCFRIGSFQKSGAPICRSQNSRAPILKTPTKRTLNVVETAN